MNLSHPYVKISILLTVAHVKPLLVMTAIVTPSYLPLEPFGLNIRRARLPLVGEAMPSIYTKHFHLAPSAPILLKRNSKLSLLWIRGQPCTPWGVDVVLLTCDLQTLLLLLPTVHKFTFQKKAILSYLPKMLTAIHLTH